MTATETNIGRMAVVVYQDKLYVGNVLDCVAGTTRPKRIRIQNDVFMQGKVIQPSEYEFKEWCDDTD